MNRYMRRVPAAVLGLGMLLSNGGDSAHEVEPTFPPVSVSTANESTSADVPMTYAAPEAAATIGERQKETLRLLGSSASINIIYVSVSNAVVTESAAEKDKADFRAKLTQGDPKLGSGFAQAVSWATYGRVNPASVSVTKVPAIKLINGCMDDNNSQELTKVENAARAGRDKNALNVVALDAESCVSPDGTRFAGYGSTELTPVFSNEVFLVRSDGLAAAAPVFAHELGHAAGLNHAGKADCVDPVTISGCTVDPTGDQNSIMSYAASNGRFTAADMYNLGLLYTSEVAVNPLSGTVKLVPMEQKGKKLIVIPGAGVAQNRYISYGMDPYAALTTVCDPHPLAETASRSDDYTHFTMTIGDKQYACYQTNKTGMITSVQVRFQDVAKGSVASMAMVDTRKDASPADNPSPDAAVSNGYTARPETVLINGEKAFRFESVTSHNEAVIAINALIPQNATI